MRKTYQLNLEGKNRDRLLESSKHDIRKYIRRERRKDLPEGADYWDFDMRFGVDEASAVALPPAELIRSINALVADGGDQFFVEILRKPGSACRAQRAIMRSAMADWISSRTEFWSSSRWRRTAAGRGVAGALLTASHGTSEASCLADGNWHV